MIFRQEESRASDRDWGSLMREGVQAHSVSRFNDAHVCFAQARLVAEKSLDEAASQARRSGRTGPETLAEVEHFATAVAHLALNSRCWGRFEITREALEGGLEQLTRLFEDQRLASTFRHFSQRHAQRLAQQLACLLQHGGASDPAMAEILGPYLERLEPSTTAATMREGVRIH
ncbi:MAG: hypothetical protein HRU51_04280 [Xanthomonadales bacterium]|nr:hypothetical protein [Xanthomonadales bacterium]